MIESPRAVWRRSTRCVSDHHCVEVADLDGMVGLRNSQSPELSLVFSRQTWQGFLEGIQTGDFTFDEN
jgi:hypothetical protein